MLKIAAKKALTENESEIFDDDYDFITNFYEEIARKKFPELDKTDRGTIHIVFIKCGNNFQDKIKIEILNFK